MTHPPQDVIVIGGGVHGAASALALARSGKRTLLLEQFEFGHVRGSSHGEARIIRHAYEEAEYVRLADLAFEAWRDLERRSGETLLEPRTHLDLAPPSHPAFQAVRAALTECGSPFEELDAPELARRFPALQMPEEYHALIDSGAGLLRADVATRVLRETAAQHGAVLRDQTPVRSIEARPGHVAVETGAGRFEARELVIAAGGWVGGLLEMLGAQWPLEVLLTQSAFYAPDPAYALHDSPIFFDHPTQVYGIPEVRGGVLKIGNRHRVPVHPDRRAFEPLPENLEVLRDWITTHLTGVSPDPAAALTCLYTFTPDEDFIIDRVGDLPNVVAISACSGHGFKFGPVIGELAAALLNGAAPQPRFRAARFAPPLSVVGR
ncbi:N-methyl-L-tryptophan oxidase (plasmid) [Deinococcus sp. D7000]|nr:N-methyl-L-tryptophan oxidase [Deinococcus sp. D7000]